MHTPNSVSYILRAHKSLGTIALFVDRNTQAMLGRDDTITGLPEVFRPTLYSLLGAGSTNASFFYATSLDLSAAQQCLNEAGFLAQGSIPTAKQDNADNSWTPLPEPDAPTTSNLQFTTASRLQGPDASTPETRVFFYPHPGTVQESTILNDIDTTLLPKAGFAPLHKADYGEWSTHLDPQQIRQALQGLGLLDAGAPTHWFQPTDLLFCVAYDEGSVSDTMVTVVPRDEDSPYGDNLRSSNLAVLPDWLGIDVMENTWVVEDRTPEDVRAALEALGYTYDADLLDHF